MDTIKTKCPECAGPFEFPANFDSVRCPRCGATHEVRNYDGAISLRNLGPESNKIEPHFDRDAVGIVEARLVEIDELIADVESEIDAVRGKEQGGPLQIGCAFFGLVVIVILVIVAFMLLARSLIGGPLFYLSVALVLVIGFVRVLRRLKTVASKEQLRLERTSLEEGLAQLEVERTRLRTLRDTLASE